VHDRFERHVRRNNDPVGPNLAFFVIVAIHIDQQIELRAEFSMDLRSKSYQDH
jgi:hypothetical protein